MNLEVRYIKEKGTKDERIVFVVKENCDIGKFFVFTTKKTTEGKFSSSVNQPFWFPDKLVSAGDLVVVYTKPGSTSIKENTDGTKSHFYYRKLPNPIFIDENTIALLIECNEWKPID